MPGAVRKKGAAMQSDIEMIRELYASAEGATLDTAKFASFFSEDAYVRNVPAQMDFRGNDIALVASGMAAAFPDIHRELFNVDAIEGGVVTELAIRGTHRGDLQTPAGILPPTGRTIDVPCCDVFRIRDGKVVSFHCYNAASILVAQLTAPD